MINHISIAVEDPTRTANFLAEIWDGIAFPFPPVDGGYFVIANDGKGTAVEVLPANTILVPGEGMPDESDFSIETLTETNEGQFVKSERAPDFGPVHLNITTHLSIEKIRAIADREGWRNLVCNRDRGLFQLVEVWVDNRFMLEVMTEDQTARYREITDPSFIATAFADFLAPKPPAEAVSALA